MAELVHNPWRREFVKRVHFSGRSIYLVSPYIQSAAIKEIAEKLNYANATKKGQLEVLVLTRLNVADFVAGVSSIAALRLLMDNGAEVRACSNLHAKVYVFDNQFAYVTSSNATGQGISEEGGNLELGVKVDDYDLVKSVVLNFFGWWRDSLPVDHKMLNDVEVVVNALKQESQELNKIKKRINTAASRANLSKIPSVFSYRSFPPEAEVAEVDSKSIKRNVLDQVFKGQKYEAVPKRKQTFEYGGKTVHIRYTRYQKNGNYWFNINSNMLKADYQILVCGSPDNYYLLPNKVLRALYEVAHPDKAHVGIRSFNVYTNKQEIQGEKGSIPIGAKKYLKKNLPSTR